MKSRSGAKPAGTFNPFFKQGNHAMAKIIDTFLFVEAYEAELLLMKLHLENDLVDKFVLIESAQTFRNEEKGLQAKKLILGDHRFWPFMDKIVIIEHEKGPFDGPAGYHTFYEAEEWSRASCWDYVRGRYADDAWVIVSDVDEAVDASDPVRKRLFLEELAANPGKTVIFDHYRYWYDFDNRSPWSIRTPVVQVGSIQNKTTSFRCRSNPPGPIRNVPLGDNPVFFEYSYCFSRDAMWRKLNSFIHDGYTEADLDLALLVNAWIKASARGERFGQRGHEDWFDTVELTEANSPRYVRENISLLKTNAVSPDYKANRRKMLYGR